MRTMIVVLGLVSALASGVAAQSVDGRERRDVVLGAADLIEDRYVYPDRGEEIARRLREDVDRFSQTDADAFAAALTARLRALSADGHFAVEHRPEGLAADDGPATEDAHMARMIEHWYGKGSTTASRVFSAWRAEWAISICGSSPRPTWRRT